MYVWNEEFSFEADRSFFSNKKIYEKFSIINIISKLLNFEISKKDLKPEFDLINYEKKTCHYFLSY